MLTIDYFINGNTVDNQVIMRQWQLCQEAWAANMCISESRDKYESDWFFLVAFEKGITRHLRRLGTMQSLIDEWNKSTKIIEDQGDKLRHAVRVAQNLHESGLGEFTAIVLEELPF